MFEFLSSLLFPKRCVGCRRAGSYICANCLSRIVFVSNYFCAVCGRNSINGLTHPKCKTRNGIDGIISSIAYKGIVKKLIYQFKYKPFLSDLKVPLGKLLYEGIIQNEVFSGFISSENGVWPATRSSQAGHKSGVWITSVPLHKMRENKRGYNQSSLLAKELSESLKIPYIANLLTRRKPTRPQFELKRDERQKNIKDAFLVNDKLITANKIRNIILVDDITTTGATLAECGKTLKKSGVRSVLGVTLAHEA